MGASGVGWVSDPTRRLGEPTYGVYRLRTTSDERPSAHLGVLRASAMEITQRRGAEDAAERGEGGSHSRGRLCHTSRRPKFSRQAIFSTIWLAFASRAMASVSRLGGYAPRPIPLARRPASEWHPNPVPLRPIRPFRPTKRNSAAASSRTAARRTSKTSFSASTSRSSAVSSPKPMTPDTPSRSLSGSISIRPRRCMERLATRTCCAARARWPMPWPRDQREDGYLGA